MKIVHDFETRSAEDVKRAGPWRYAAHETTAVACLAVKIGASAPMVWLPAWAEAITGPFDHPRITSDDLRALVADPNVIWEAHNAEFERAIWTHVMPRYSVPPLPLERFECTAARAAAQSLPRSLGQVGDVLGLTTRKDAVGHRLMLKLCKPRKPRKAEREADPDWEHTLYWHEDSADYARQVSYCVQDVEAEHALSQVLRSLSEREREVWLLDQKINERGVQTDVASARSIVRTLAEYEGCLLAEMGDLTSGAVRSARQVAALRDWLHELGVETANLQKATVATLLQGSLPHKARRVLEIRQALGKASTGKFSAILDRANEEGRCQGTLMYHGAGTGRWAAKSLQPHNMPRDCYSGETLSLALRLFTGYGPEQVATLLDDPFFAASRCIRGMIMAGPGKDLVCADYSSVEARGNAWVAGQDSILEEFRQEKDLYKVAAQDIFGVAYEDVSKAQRAVGKTSELALGYGGGIGAYVAMARNYAVDLEALPDIIGPRTTAEELRLATQTAETYLGNNHGEMSLNAAIACDVIKQKWRAKRPRIVALWAGLGKAAVSAVEHPGRVYSYRLIRYVLGRDPLGNPYLFCRLPSGRILSYFGPEIRSMKTPWGQMKDVLTCMTVDGVTKQWVRRKLLGSLLCENVVQALCRDLLAEALIRVEAAGYPVVLHVHDEIVTEVPTGFGSVEELETLMCALPPWAEGLPLAAEGWRGKRFRK